MRYEVIPEETRQEYATRRIQQMQRFSAENSHRLLPLDFFEIRRAFVIFGEMYDAGFRRSDEEQAAA